METPHHTKIYGQGVKDVLKQAEIDAVFTNGVLKIKLSEDRALTVLPDTEGALHFFIETYKSPLEYSHI